MERRVIPASFIPVRVGKRRVITRWQREDLVPDVRAVNEWNDDDEVQ